VTRGIVTVDGQERRATSVLANADPFRLRQLAGARNFPSAFNARLDSMRRDGTTMKVRVVQWVVATAPAGAQSCSG
jgi:hypothetical protein